MCTKELYFFWPKMINQSSLYPSLQATMTVDHMTHLKLGTRQMLLMSQNISFIELQIVWFPLSSLAPQKDECEVLSTTSLSLTLKRSWELMHLQRER